MKNVLVPLALVLSVAPVTFGQKVYWTNMTEGQIYTGSFGSVPGTPILTAPDQPHGIALDPSEQKVYWVATNQQTGNRYHRANTDGTDVELLGFVRTPVGISLDLGAGKLYISGGWIGQTGSGEITRADLDGSNQQVIVSGLWHVGGSALDLGFVLKLYSAANRRYR